MPMDLPEHVTERVICLMVRVLQVSRWKKANPAENAVNNWDEAAAQQADMEDLDRRIQALDPSQVYETLDRGVSENFASDPNGSTPNANGFGDVPGGNAVRSADGVVARTAGAVVTSENVRRTPSTNSDRLPSNSDRLPSNSDRLPPGSVWSQQVQKGVVDTHGNDRSVFETPRQEMGTIEGHNMKSQRPAHIPPQIALQEEAPALPGHLAPIRTNSQPRPIEIDISQRKFVSGGQIDFEVFEDALQVKKTLWCTSIYVEQSTQ